ncbi:hypothetical protein M445_26090 [Vibrio owensii 47666-1]|uniref:hypothetical protein n=1 Tax=Vibrio owensii TaxID=696485 RepID=UPI000584C6F2|nr:hypothetical protein [Vibrio owensii]KIF44530.1 hypothetical protein M445_26090 [Vibrio owensii 47666-1]
MMADKTEMLDSIRRFIEVLNSSDIQIIQDPSPLYQLKSTLERRTTDRGLAYTLDDLRFVNISGDHFISGGNWIEDTLDVRLNLNLFLYPDKNFEFGSVKESVVEITYEALNTQGRISRGAWHLDRHDHSGVPSFIHPDYHIHHGGRHIKDNTNDYGELVLLNTPRLLHPPLDIFLAFDFLLTNFYDRRVWASFRANPSYIALIKNAQEYWWKEYYTQIANYWKHQTSGIDDVGVREKAQISNPYLYV